MYIDLGVQKKCLQCLERTQTNDMYQTVYWQLKPKLTVFSELTADKTLNDKMTLTTLEVPLNWQSLQKVLIEKTILLKNLLTFEVSNLRRLGFCFLLALSCKVKVITQMVQTLFKESYKDKFDQLHHMQAIAHVLISLLFQCWKWATQTWNAHLKTRDGDWQQSESSGRIATTEHAPAGLSVRAPYLEWAYFKTGFATASQHVGIGKCWIKHVTTTH